MDKKLKLAVVIGARSDEYATCLTIGEYVFSLLDRKKYEISSVRVTEDGERWLFPKDPNTLLPKKLEEAPRDSYDTLTIGQAIDRLRAEKTDIVFLATPGGLGENGSFQGLFQSAGLKYTSSAVAASALAMDKLRASKLYEAAGLKTPKTLSFHRRDFAENASACRKEIKTKIGIPCFVKPSANGSSIGAGPVKKIEDLDERMKAAFAKSPHVLVQELISGKELTCAVLDDGKNAPIVFTPTEIIPLHGEFYNYEAKCVLEHGMDEINPPNLPQEIIKKIQHHALTAHKALGCLGLSRTDIFLTPHNELYVLETNTIPGMTATSVYANIVGNFGLTMQSFFDKIIQGGLNREVF